MRRIALLMNAWVHVHPVRAGFRLAAALGEHCHQEGSSSDQPLITRALASACATRCSSPAPRQGRGQSPWHTEFLQGHPPQTQHQHQHGFATLSAMMDEADRGSSLLAGIRGSLTHGSSSSNAALALRAQLTAAAADSPESVRALCSLVRSSCQELTGPELCRVLWALAVVGTADHGTIHAVLEVLYSKLGELSPDDFASAVWGLACLGHYEHEVMAAFTEFVWEALPNCTPRQLAAIAGAYAQFGHYDDDDDFFSAVAARSCAQVEAGTASGQDAALVLRALATLQHGAQKLCAQVTHSLIAGNGSMLPIAPAELADILWSCAVLLHRDDRFLAAAATYLMAVPLDVHAFRGAQAQAEKAPASSGSAAKGSATNPAPGPASSCRGLHKPGHTHIVGAPHGGGHVITASVVHDPLLPSPAKTLSQLHAAAGPGSVTHPATAMQTNEASGAMTPDVLVRCVWAFAVLGWHQPQLTGAAFRVLRDVPPSALSSATLAQLMLAHLKSQELHPSAVAMRNSEAESYDSWRVAARSRPGPDVPTPAQEAAAQQQPQSTAQQQQQQQTRIPPQLLPYAFAALQYEMSKDLEAGRYTSWKYRNEEALSRTALHNAVVRALEQEGITPLPAAAPMDAAVPLSIAVRDGSSGRGAKLFAFEPLSPADCLRHHPHQPIGPVVSRLESLAFRGWQVVPIPFHEWASLPPEPEAKRAYVRAKLDLAKARLAQSKGRATSGVVGGTGELASKM